MSVAYDHQFVFQISHTWSKPDFVTQRLVKFSFFSFRYLILKLVNFRLSQFSPVHVNRYSKHLESNYWTYQPSVDLKMIPKKPKKSKSSKFWGIAKNFWLGKVFIFLVTLRVVEVVESFNKFQLDTFLIWWGESRRLMMMRWVIDAATHRD